MQFTNPLQQAESESTQRMRQAEQQRAEADRVAGIQDNLRTETVRRRSSLFGMRSLLGSGETGGLFRSLFGSR